MKPFLQLYRSQVFFLCSAEEVGKRKFGVVLQGVAADEDEAKQASETTRTMLSNWIVEEEWGVGDTVLESKKHCGTACVEDLSVRLRIHGVGN